LPGGYAAVRYTSERFESKYDRSSYGGIPTFIELARKITELRRKMKSRCLSYQHILKALRPYEAGRTVEAVRRQYGLNHIAKLASNENPLGASPKAVEALTRSLSGLNSYPNGGLELREVLAAKFDLKVENVIAGSGSEGIMSSIIRTFLGDEDEVLTTDAAFIGFQVLARSRGVKYRTVPYRDWHYDLPALAAAINPNTKIIYLANPNNPTGTIFTKLQFHEFYTHVPERALIILDEAYFEYADDDPRYPDSMHYRYDNVITLRTFSKIYGLAGVRIGYGFAHEELIRNLLKVKLPFEPSTPAQAAGIGALADREFLHRSLELNARGLRHLTEGLMDAGFRVVPSRANFVMVILSSEQEANRIFEELLAQGVIVRPLKAFGLPECLRVSTGTDEDTALCVESFRRSYAATTGASHSG
jgi:histidinol-phosphate aminotransferase